MWFEIQNVDSDMRHEGCGGLVYIRQFEFAARCVKCLTRFSVEPSSLGPSSVPLDCSAPRGEGIEPEAGSPGRSAPVVEPRSGEVGDGEEMVREWPGGGSQACYGPFTWKIVGRHP